jgi:hypothetical protein
VAARTTGEPTVSNAAQASVSRKVLRTACLVLPVAGVVVWLWYALGPGYYREYNRIKARLTAIPGVTVIDSGGNADLTFEDIWAHIRVQGRGDLSLWALTEKSFSTAQYLALNGIDRYSIHWTQCGYHGVYNIRDRKPVRSLSGGFTLGLRDKEIHAGNQLIGTLPVPIRNVQELVIHYDVVTAWMDEHQGKLFEAETPDGKLTWLIAARPPATRMPWVTLNPSERAQTDPPPRLPRPDTCR